MMNYPDSGIKAEFFSTTKPQEYLKLYLSRLSEQSSAIPEVELQRAIQVVEEASQAGRMIFVAGNGGSSAISQHLCCDWMKGTQIGNLPPIRVLALGTNQSLLTAISNDYGYEHSFSAQLDMLGKPKDVGVFISSSGNSSNIIRAVEMAKEKLITTIGMTGFDGGRLRDLADIKLHVPVKNYGIVEDFHQILMHVIAQVVYLKRR